MADTLLLACHYYGIQMDANLGSITDYLTYYNKISEKINYPIAQYFIGLIHLGGVAVTKDVQLAFKYMKLAADNEFSLAQCKLGRMLMAGLGADKSIEEGLSLIEKSS